MNTRTTTNQDEISVTITRSDDSRIDFCHMLSLGEVIIGETNPAGDSHTHIVLSMEEAQALQKHLTTVLGLTS